MSAPTLAALPPITTAVRKLALSVFLNDAARAERVAMWDDYISALRDLRRAERRFLQTQERIEQADRAAAARS